jgi:hypothetical protein
MINIQNAQRLVIATALASSFVVTGVAASAQTTTTPSATNATSNVTNVSMSTSTNSAQDKMAKLAQISADQRRIAFRFQGTSL